MAEPNKPAPASLKGDQKALSIEWSDGVRHTLSWSLLRKVCPCATCRHERANPPQQEGLLPVIKPEEAQPVRATDMRPVGNYAYGIQFNDGHNTGIYSLDFLRRLGEQVARDGLGDSN